MSEIKNNLVCCMSVFTLFAFVNFMIGCTANANISFEDVEKKPNMSIPRVVLVTEIVGVTLRAGGEVKFNEQRGIYDRKADWIRGTILVGDSVEILLSDIEYVILRRAGIERSQTIKVEAQGFKKTQQTQSWKVVDGRSVRPGNVVRFDGAGGRYDVEKQLITGITENGKYVEIAVDEILFFQHRKFSAGNAFRIVGLFFLVAIIICAADPAGCAQRNGTTGIEG
ncbi:MAG: hypothetical protein IID63_03925 [candidate division Zixibacteria bacterium]|nr:hypothetical protein [candidate division Zixibacteria bacterium]